MAIAGGDGKNANFDDRRHHRLTCRYDTVDLDQLSLMISRGDRSCYVGIIYVVKYTEYLMHLALRERTRASAVRVRQPAGGVHATIYYLLVFTMYYL